jgi:hypothetical protein
VEHIQPKIHVPALLTDWNNFLLGCVNCNSSKGDTRVDLDDYFWPDGDNTLRGFEYDRGGMIRPHPSLSVNLAAKAQATLALTGLDRDPGNSGRKPTSADRRWLRRQETWGIAEHCRNRLVACDTVEVRELIVEVAKGRGGFSIWWAVFAHDTDIRRRLREAFVGTHLGSFDSNEELIPRIGGQL